jgi:hypothetical protein
VILQPQRQFFGMRSVGRTLAIRGGSAEFDVVLHEHAIVQGSHLHKGRHSSFFDRKMTTEN